MFPACGASGQEHTSQPSQPELHATVTPARKPAIVVPSSRPLLNAMLSHVYCYREGFYEAIF